MLPPGKSATVESLSPEEQIAEVSYEDGRKYSYDLVKLFEFRDDIGSATANHAAQQQFWESVAVDLIFRAREFEEDGYARWWAHSRRYARYVLRLTGQRDTIELVRDWVIILFSKDVTPENRQDYARAAWKGFLIERHGSDTAADKAIANSKAPPFDGFETDMFVYVDAGWTYEHIMGTFRWLEEQAQKVKSVAKILQDRSFKMHEFVELEKAKYGNIGPMTIDEIVDQVASRVLKKQGAGTIGSDFNERDFIQNLQRSTNASTST